MRRPLPTFRELVERLSTGQGDGSSSRPLIGSLSSLDYRVPAQARESWAILHSISDAGLKLIHPHRLRCENVVVTLAGPAGEKLQAVMHRLHTESIGDLYETAAEFLRGPLRPAKARSALAQHVGENPSGGQPLDLENEPRWSVRESSSGDEDDETRFGDESDQTFSG